MTFIRHRDHFVVSDRVRNIVSLNVYNGYFTIGHEFTVKKFHYDQREGDYIELMDDDGLRVFVHNKSDLQRIE